MAVSARFKRPHAHDCCSHGRGDDHEVVSGTTAATEEQDDEEPQEEATAGLTGGHLPFEVLSGVNSRGACSVGLTDVILGFVLELADVVGSGPANKGYHVGVTGSVGGQVSA